MSKEMNYYKFIFSSGTVDIAGKNLVSSAEKEVERIRLNKLNKIGISEISEEEIELIKKNMTSKRQAEKDLLLTLASLVVKSDDGKGLARFNKLADLSQRIDSSEDWVEIEAEELEWLKKAFESGHKDRPMWWWRCIEILKQLEEPIKIDNISKTS